MKEELLSLANQQDANGSFIFGGFKTKTQPFQKNINGEIEYQGDSGTTSLSISETMVVETSVDGESLFQKLRVIWSNSFNVYNVREYITLY